MKWAKRRVPKITHTFRKQTLVRSSLVLLVALFGVSMISSIYTPQADAITKYTVNVTVQYATGKVPKSALVELFGTNIVGGGATPAKNLNIKGTTGTYTFTDIVKDPEQTMQACAQEKTGGAINEGGAGCAVVTLKGSTGTANISFKSGKPVPPVDDKTKHTVYVYTKYDPSKKQTGKDTITLTGSSGVAMTETPTITNHVATTTYTGIQAGNTDLITVCSKDLGGKCQTAHLSSSSITVTLAYDGSSGSSVGKKTPSWYTSATKDSDSDDDSGEPQCGSDNSPMSWAICPIYNIVATATDHFDNLINKLLHVNTDVFKAGDRYEQPYYTAWASFRNIALIFLIIAGVVMVIAQATGARAIDAYTIKRVMPRLLFAAIAITLSWIVLIFLINVSNVIGEGVQALIYGPFNSLSSTGGGNGAGGTITGIGELGILSVIGVTAFVLTGGGLLSFIVVAGIAILVGLLVVVLRQILVVFLLIVSPLAIAAYVLPNTQKVAHDWWDWFLRALIMFPLITGFIAIGKVFSLVSLNQATSDPAFGIVAIIAYVLPYFLLPLTFKFAGSAMGTLAHGVHGLGKKAAGGGMMQAMKDRNKEKNKLGTRFGRGNAFTRKLSDTTMAGARAPEWVKGNPRNWRGNLSAMRATDEITRGDEAAMKDPMLDSFAGDTDAMTAGLAYNRHHSNDQLAQDLLKTSKYTSEEERAAFKARTGREMAVSDLSEQKQRELSEDQSRIVGLYRHHGEAASRAFLNKLSQDPNGWLEQTIYEKNTDGSYKLDDKGQKIAKVDENGNVVKRTVAEQAYQAAIDYGGGDMNKTVRAAMMIRANQARAGRGDVADTSAGTLIGQLTAAMKNNGKFTDEMAQTVISNGIVSHDAIDQARQKPRSVQTKVDTIKARVNNITKNGKLTVEQVINNAESMQAGKEKDKAMAEATELQQLLGTMQHLGAGMATSYSSAEVATKTQEGMEVVIHNQDVGRHMAGSQGGGNPQDADRVVREQMEREVAERNRPPEP